jgi:Amt family ammonium transporter
MALIVTHISASMATITWMAIEWVRFGKPSVLGAATGAIAGLAAVTPASGYIGPFGGFVIGIASGAICWYAAAVLKQRLGYDDSLDVFGVHGVGGFVGTVLAGVLAAGAFGGLEGDLDIGSQVGKQLLAALITVGYTAVATYLLLKVTGTIVPLRVESREELEGLDLSLHNEAGYNL